jgi:hypothetical protein
MESIMKLEIVSFDGRHYEIGNRIAQSNYQQNGSPSESFLRIEVREKSETA